MKFQNLVNKAYRSTAQFKLDQLMAEESRWKRKATIANNKLSAVRRKINAMAVELVMDK